MILRDSSTSIVPMILFQSTAEFAIDPVVDDDVVVVAAAAAIILQ